jgi:pilus assembly protein FimV
LKNRVSYFVALMAVLTVVAAPSHAFTLGDLRGSVVIGRSLDVSVPVLPGSGEEALASCLSAEVLFADAQQISSLTVTPVTAGPVPTALVRIRASALVDEPVVSVLLRSSCGGVTSRRYVLLSDFPAPDLPRGESASVVANASRLPPTALTVPQHGAVNADAAVPAKAAVRAAKPKPVVKKPATPVKRAPPPEPAVAKSVLKLDPQPFLPVQGEVPVPVVLPVSAAASAPSDEVVQQALHIQALQNDVKTLKELAAKNQASLMELQAKLSQAEAERVPMSWFFLVVGLLLALLGALTWLLRKQQKAKKADWWQHAQNDAQETQVITPASTLQPAAPATDFGKFVATRMTSAATEVQSTQAEPDLDLDLDLNSLSTAGKAQTTSEPLAMEPLDEFAAGRNINLETISDIRQQAEFFVSLGQTDRALNILRKQILETTEPNPLVYLDLLSLYHSLGLKADFRELRSAFNQFFNVVAPDFPAYNLEGRDLLEYAEPLAVLSRFWPNIEAIAFLEACIFHNDAAPMQLSFDLAAFRDLLMLHAVAEKVTSDSPWKNTSHGGLEASSLAHAEMAELAMTMRGLFDDAMTDAARHEAADTRGDSNEFPPVISVAAPPAQGLDLDLDLDAPSATPDAQNPKGSRSESGNSPFRNSRF